MRHQIVQFLLAFGILALDVPANAQEFQKIRQDYFSGPIQYSPADPWTRSKVFNAHTGNSGRFYNCDGEQCKRNSPYIYWRAHCEPDLPPRRGLWGGLKIDAAKVCQRYRDGAGACAAENCQCETCTQQRLVTVEHPMVDRMANPNLSESETSISKKGTNALVTAQPEKQLHAMPNLSNEREYGLLTPHPALPTLGTTANQLELATQQSVPQTVNKVKLIDPQPERHIRRSQSAARTPALAKETPATLNYYR